jgi:hypothetical protein
VKTTRKDATKRRTSRKQVQKKKKKESETSSDELSTDSDSTSDERVQPVQRRISSSSDESIVQLVQKPTKLIPKKVTVVKPKDVLTKTPVEKTGKPTADSFAAYQTSADDAKKPEAFTKKPASGVSYGSKVQPAANKLPIKPSMVGMDPRKSVASRPIDLFKIPKKAGGNFSL